MSACAKKAIAADTEDQTREIVDARGSVRPVKAGSGSARLLKVTDKTGKVTGYTTHGKVVEAVALAIDVEIATVDGRRPTRVRCIDCGVPREVKGPSLPKRCVACEKKEVTARSVRWQARARVMDEEAFLAKHRERMVRQKAKNPEKTRARARAYQAKNRAAIVEKKAARRARSKASLEAAGNGRPAQVLCVTCGASRDVRRATGSLPIYCLLCAEARTAENRRNGQRERRLHVMQEIRRREMVGRAAK